MQMEERRGAKKTLNSFSLEEQLELQKGLLYGKYSEELILSEANLWAVGNCRLRNNKDISGILTPKEVNANVAEIANDKDNPTILRIIKMQYCSYLKKNGKKV